MKIIMKYNGTALFDTVSQKFKLEIEKKIKIVTKIIVTTII